MSTKQDAEWASERVWAFCREEKTLVLPGTEPQIIHPIASPLHRLSYPLFRVVQQTVHRSVLLICSLHGLAIPPQEKNLNNIILFNVPFFVNKICLAHSSTGNATGEKQLFYISLLNVPFKDSVNVNTGLDCEHILLFRRRRTSSSRRYIALIQQFRTNKTINIA